MRPQRPCTHPAEGAAANAASGGCWRADQYCHPVLDPAETTRAAGRGLDKPRGTSWPAVQHGDSQGATFDATHLPCLQASLAGFSILVRASGRLCGLSLHPNPPPAPSDRPCPPLLPWLPGKLRAPCARWAAAWPPVASPQEVRTLPVPPRRHQPASRLRSCLQFAEPPPALHTASPGLNNRLSCRSPLPCSISLACSRACQPGAAEPRLFCRR